MVYICVICMATQARLWTLSDEHRNLLLAILSPAVRPKDWDRLKNTLLLACSDCKRLVQSVVGFQGTALAGVTHLLSLLPSVETEQDATVLQEKEDRIITHGPKNSSYLAIQSLQEFTNRYVEGSPHAGAPRPSVCVDTMRGQEALLEAPDPLSLLKDEKLEDSLLEINSYIEMQPELETKPLTQVDVKVESASEPGAPAADSRTAAVEPKREDNTLVGDTTISDQNAHNSSTQGTPVTRCDTKITTFTHGSMKVTPRGNVVYGSMLSGNPGHGVVPSGNIVCGSTPTNFVQNYQMNHVTRPMLATLAKRNGVKLARREQVTGVTSVPGSISIDVDTGNEQTDKQENSQPKSGPWYVQFLSEAEILAEREAARSAPDFAEAPHKCDACLVVFDSYDDKDAHDSSVHMCSAGGYSCGICGYSVDNPNELRAHASRHSTRFCCSHCQFRTPDESVIRRHYCTNMPQHRKPRENRKRNRRPPGKYKCSECKGRYQKEAQLQAHIERLHSKPSGPITCEVCKKEFRNKYKYNLHMYRHKKLEERERGAPPRPDLFCAECVKEFESKAAYENHMMTLKHFSKENWQFECDICKRKFPNKTRVGDHIMKIHLKPQKYKCDQCLKDYSSKVSLRRHKLSHAPADARAAADRRLQAADRRPHVCHLCGKAFTIPKSLREHLLMHEGLRPFKCPLCPATFTYSAALYTHNRLKHLKVKGNWKKKAKNKKTKKGAAKSTELPTD